MAGLETKMECLNCGLDFQINRMWQKFCCKQCQQRWNYLQRVGDQVDDLKGNGAIHERQHDDAYRTKWAARRAEWAQEDREEQQGKPKFVRRI